MNSLLHRVEHNEYTARRAGKEVEVKERHGFRIKGVFDDNF
jgi:hypothetical protein